MLSSIALSLKWGLSGLCGLVPITVIGHLIYCSCYHYLFMHLSLLCLHLLRVKSRPQSSNLLSHVKVTDNFRAYIQMNKIPGIVIADYNLQCVK